MDQLEELLKNQLVSSILLILIGAMVTFVITKIANKTAKLKYTFSFERIGVTTDDAVFGSVRTTWQGHDIRNLHLSTIQIENSSSRDFENLKLKVYSGKQTIMLNQSTQILDTPFIVPYSKEFEDKMKVPEGEKATDSQINDYNSNRDYEVPVLNRGQVMKLSYLSTNPKDDGNPAIFISSPAKGIRLVKQKLPYVILNPIFGTPIPSAIIRALILSVVVVAASGLWISNIWIASSVCMAFGLVGQLFGAVFYRIEKYIKNLITG